MSGSSSESPYAHNMRTLNLRHNECALWYQLMEDLETDGEGMQFWPEGLQDLVKHRTKTLGISQAPISECVADWIRGIRADQPTVCIGGPNDGDILSAENNQNMLLLQKTTKEQVAISTYHREVVYFVPNSGKLGITYTFYRWCQMELRQAVETMHQRCEKQTQEATSDG